jgi:hypothetical protein
MKKKIIDLIGEKNYNQYYNLDDFKESNEEFEKYLDKCIIKSNNKIEFNKFEISTITSILKVADFFFIKVLFERLNINDDIKYIEYRDSIKGVRKKNKQKKNRNKKRNKIFGNQLSIGFNCKKHKHNKAICVKVFSKGNLTITGSKSKEEIIEIYDKLIKYIKDIDMDYKYDNKKINIPLYKNLYPKKEVKINIETVNGTFKCLFKINLNNFKKVISKKYTSDEIFIKDNRSALIELDLKNLKTFDEKKGVFKISKISIYGTGSIVFNSKNIVLIKKSYNFIKDFIIKNFNEIVDKNYVFNL